MEGSKTKLTALSSALSDGKMVMIDDDNDDYDVDDDRNEDYHHHGDDDDDDDFKRPELGEPSIEEKMIKVGEK